MESRNQHALVAPVQQKGAAASPGRKQKLAAGGEEKNRIALGDIGNLVVVRGADGKVQPRISCPAARLPAAQLLGKAQAAEPDKKPANVRGKEGTRVAKQKVWVKPKTEEASEISVGSECAKFAQKVSIKSKTEELVDISSASDATLKLTERKASVPASSRRGIGSLTSVLAARSKAACEVHNIDKLDEEDELAVVDYVEDIYKFYKCAETCSRPCEYMASQVELNAKMRLILVDWLIEVHSKFELMPETLYLTLYIIDQYLSVETVSRKELQLVGVSSMLIACKYEEIWAPQVGDFINISDCAYRREQILAAEKAILNKLKWNLTVPTPYVFLVRFLKAAMADKEMEDMVFFFAELGLMHYSMMIKYCPSIFAAAAVYAARCTLKKRPLWTETLEHHTGYYQPHLLDCAQNLVIFHASASKSKLKAVYMKYSSSLRGAVALHSPATQLLEEEEKS